MVGSLERRISLPYIPNTLRPSDVEQFPVDRLLLARIPDLMTPKELLQIEDFTKPAVITPDKYPDFDSLLIDREKVRYLALLPIKTDEQRSWYHAQPKDQLMERVRGYLGEESMALAPNYFPDLLPADLRQMLLWVENQVPEQSVEEFVAKSMMVYDLTPDDLILFERSTKTKSRLVRGTFPELRHIHFWARER